ncbi:MAG: 30S ribosomal protein S16 [Propionibacteriaceae bacterium]|nr:30S ribosomal protein S16 [Propionibacteriaceae bacterium]
MAVKIRLKRLGKIRSPHYRIVVMDSRTKRDGRAIEEIGIYHPKNDPSVIRVDSDRAQYWLGVGAQPTEAVIALFKRSGDWQKFSGDTSPSGIEPQPAKADKLARYNEAVGAAQAEAEAISKPKRSAKKAEDKAEKADEPKAEEPKAEAPKAEEPQAETAEAEAPAEAAPEKTED